ncbi:hypothetical protein KL86DPRO_50160 [uncultured delta proteobacterium]|uniref:Uncharacterized protein n=1 Tax=uncultured delta proteobacterium TaxID=34034 RepID=A0A212KCK7_9DELT|nr:hypothetical protein KL86DPRO_50160 [uncultured delta proteobacterium]
MSGTSRIGGYGGYAGTGGKDSRSASLARFCKGRKQGDVVSGVFLRLETETLGWALLEGEELLAHLPENWQGAEDWREGGNRPSPGDKVFFRIEALRPEVVLRMLPAADPLARLSALVPSVPLAQEAGLYVAARDKFDALLAGFLAKTPGLFAAPDPASRKAAFINLVAADAGLLGAFAETSARSRALCRAAAPAGLLFFQHMPWLSGGLTQIEVSLWSEGDAPVFAGARLPSGDTMTLRGVMESGALRYRLAVSGPKGDAFRARFSPARTGAAEYRGSDRLAGNQAADLVGRILALAADSGTMATGRFSRKL